VTTGPHFIQVTFIISDSLTYPEPPSIKHKSIHYKISHLLHSAGGGKQLVDIGNQLTQQAGQPSDINI